MLLFGFANAGVSRLFDPLPLGIEMGLFVGKQLGIFGSARLAIRLGWADRPRVPWLQIYGLSLLCGIGFTMSPFINALAFPGEPALADLAKIGNLGGSILSAIAGFLVLRFAPFQRADGKV